MTKMRIGLLFGGRSGEHEVSISSARAIAQALATDENASKYEVLPFYIQKNGRWLSGTLPQQVLSTGKSLEIEQPTEQDDSPTSRQFPNFNAVDVWLPVL
ncbi:MAG: D-alanine--D-alanine ligase, partial [Microcoleus sp.]